MASCAYNGVSCAKHLLVFTGNSADWGWLLDCLRNEQVVAAAAAGKLKLTICDMWSRGRVSEEVTALFHRAEVIVDDEVFNSSDLCEKYLEAASFLDDYLEEHYRVGHCFDGVLLLGDRAETLGAAGILRIRSIPIHHLFAGDRSGCLDDSFRDGISMMASHLYTPFESALVRCRSLKRLRGTQIESVNPFTVSFSVDERVLETLKLRGKRFAVARFHPETLHTERPARWINEVVRQAHCGKLDRLLVFPPNHDTGYEEIEQAWRAEAAYYTLPEVQAMVPLRLQFVDEVLPRAQYLYLLHKAQWIAGNSSSFVLEYPFVNANGVVRLYGKRQDRRDYTLCREAALPFGASLLANLGVQNAVSCPE